MNRKIEYITCESGDWEVVKLDGEVFAGNHNIGSCGWLALLIELGCEIINTEISDKEMEEGKY